MLFVGSPPQQPAELFYFEHRSGRNYTLTV
jgi:hypothetical protein